MKSIIFTTVSLLASCAMAEVFQIDPLASQVEWKAGKKTGSYHQGTIQVKRGEVQSDAKGVLKSAQVVIDMKTISNDDLKPTPDYQAKLVGHLASDDFFKVDKFPEASFKLNSIQLQPGSKDQYLVKGELTIIGITNPVEFPATLVFDKNTLTGQAELKIERLNWGLKYGSGSLFKSLTADKIINDYFDLKLKLIAKKK